MGYTIKYKLSLPEKNAKTFLRIAIGIVFIWFGLLKIFDVSPVKELVMDTTPFLPYPLSFTLLGIFETFVGVALVANRFVKTALYLAIAHLALATALTLFYRGFQPNFPILSLEGEFVVKNIVLVASAFVLLKSKNITSV